MRELQLRNIVSCLIRLNWIWDFFCVATHLNVLDWFWFFFFGSGPLDFWLIKKHWQATQENETKKHLFRNLSMKRMLPTVIQFSFVSTSGLNKKKIHYKFVVGRFVCVCVCVLNDTTWKSMNFEMLADVELLRNFFIFAGNKTHTQNNMINCH